MICLIMLYIESLKNKRRMITVTLNKPYDNLRWDWNYVIDHLLSLSKTRHNMINTVNVAANKLATYILPVGI